MKCHLTSVRDLKARFVSDPRLAKNKILHCEVHIIELSNLIVEALKNSSRMLCCLLIRQSRFHIPCPTLDVVAICRTIWNSLTQMICDFQASIFIVKVLQTMRSLDTQRISIAHCFIRE